MTTTVDDTTTTHRPLTRRQREVLRTVHALVAANGCYPTFRELMAALAVRSPNAVKVLLEPLARRGLVAFAGGRGTARRVRLAGMRLVPEYAGDAAGRRLLAELYPAGGEGE